LRQELQLISVLFERNEEVLLHLTGVLRDWEKEAGKEQRNPGSLGQIA